jgi:hypothetical protein
MWKITTEPAPIAIIPNVSNPSRNQAARRRVSGLGWVIPKVLKNADARASSRRILRFYAAKGALRCRTSGQPNPQRWEGIQFPVWLAERTLEAYT